MKLTSAQDAIKQAIKGGWKDNRLKKPDVRARNLADDLVGGKIADAYERMIDNSVFLDIIFWHHSARRWGGKTVSNNIGRSRAILGSFIDHLADGKSAEEFFSQLR